MMAVASCPCCDRLRTDKEQLRAEIHLTAEGAKKVVKTLEEQKLKIHFLEAENKVLRRQLGIDQQS